MAQGTREKQYSQSQQQQSSTRYAVVSHTVDDHRHHGTPNYNQDHAGSTALLMGARPKESPNVEIQHHSIEYYANQLANIERQSGVVHQDAARTYSHGRNSPHQSTGQQDSQADCNRQRADDYAVQQYQRMLLREQARRNRELERR